ncbi:MAG TPA: hypothetical protein DCZ92_12260 [Elusimicrobia bacterium]|nr:MAG: hypothetical protein A2016_00945 [Elusimicrobia bacterium GWF2_62_30]HBA61562.1 hypothetical protein [Elusimicrobiota bacterium]
MNKIAKLLILVLLACAAQPAGAYNAAITSSDSDSSDSAFFADLAAVARAAGSSARKNKMSPAKMQAYIDQQVQKYTKFNQFAKAELVDHSVGMVGKMGDPDGMLAQGKALVSADAASWKGYDYQASGWMLKKNADKALEAYQLALAKAPEMQKDWYRYMMAGCHRQKGDAAKALELYRTVLANDKNWMAVKGASLAAGLLLLENRRAAEGAELFDKGLLLASARERSMLLGQAGFCAKFKQLGAEPMGCDQSN